MEVAISVDLHIRGRIACRRSASKTDRSLAQHSPPAPSSALQILVGYKIPEALRTGSPRTPLAVHWLPSEAGTMTLLILLLGIVDLPC